ncbi:PspC domain-containing protein [Cellulomonas soli]|uniref:PspC domain-containing protein n=1 Tax=Cellulomonas soli TaxID=931535 RepID=UPI003F84528E
MDTQTPDGTAAGGAPEPGPAPAPEAGPTGATPPPPGWAPGQSWAPAPGAPATSNGFFAGVRRLGVVRTEDRWIGGVASGLARRLGVDALLVRAVLAVSVLLGGLGLVVYGVAWALLPEERDGRIHLEEMVAGRFDIGLLGAFGMTIVGLGRGTDVFWLLHVPQGLQGLAWVLFVGGLIALVVVAVNHRDGRPSAPRPTSPYGPGAPTGPYGPYRPAPQGPPAGPVPPAPTAPPVTPTGATSVPLTSETSSHMSATQPLPVPERPAPQAPASPYGPAPYASTPYPPAPSSPYGPTPHTPTATTPPPYGPTYGPYPTVGAPPVATAPKPPKPPRRGPGGTTVGVVVALSLLGLAVLMLADRTGTFDGPVLLTAGGIAVVLAGLGIMVSGLRGRTSGLLGFLAIVGLVVLAPATAIEDGTVTWTDGTTVGSTSQWTPVSRSEAEQGLSVGAGDTVADLTGLRLGGDPVEVPISMGVGDLRIVVPEGAAVRAVVTNGAGSVTWDVDGDSQTVDALGISDRTFETQSAQDGQAELVLEVSLGAGEITIEEN